MPNSNPNPIPKPIPSSKPTSTSVPAPNQVKKFLFITEKQIFI